MRGLWMICKKCKKVFYDCCGISPVCPACEKGMSKSEIAALLKD